MPKIKITIEEDGEKKEYNCTQYWVFVVEETEDKINFHTNSKMSPLFRGQVQSHVTLSNIADYMNDIQKKKGVKNE